MLNILLKVRRLARLLAINLAKVVFLKKISQTARDLTLVTKGYIWEPLALIQQLVKFAVHISYSGGDMYFICHMTPQDHSIEVSCTFMGDSSLQYVTIFKSLVIIGNLIVKKKNASWKTWILKICAATKILSCLDNH